MQKNTELIQLEMSVIRQINLAEEQKRRFWSLKQGYIGESEVAQWLEKYADDSWHVLSDYWFNYKSTMQADFLLIKENHWLVIEVKNFDGEFEYRNHECYINAHLMENNFMNAMATKVRRLTRIANEVSENIKVTGAMIFINEHCQVKLDYEFDYEIIQRNQFRNFLKKQTEFLAQPLLPAYLNRIQKVLNRYSIENPFQPTGLPIEDFATIHKGVTCPACHRFDVEITLRKVTCRHCHFKEAKSETILRSARQLRYVFFDNSEIVTTENVYQFMGASAASRSLIRDILGKNFKKVGKTNKTYYEIEI